MGITLTVTAKGQVTLRKEVLQHLGIEPGDRLEVDLLPSGRLQLRAKSGKPISRLYGILQRPGQRRLSIEDINEAAAAGWAGEE
jgi:AbrB family looped-hinge helix DNA binding protein